MEKEYSKLQLEDKALKSAAMYFGQELLPYFKIEKKIKRMLPTEQIRLDAVRATEDTLFEMEDGTLAHFEFESVEVNEDDLRRFRMYDAYNGAVYRKTVITYVICSGKVTHIKNELREGLNLYRIVPLQMKQRNADKLIRKLQKKAEKGEKISKEDLVPLLLTPLMAGKSSIKRRILATREIIGSAEKQLEKDDLRHMEGIIYAFACKFLEKTDLMEIKEVLGMTVLGEMIWNDGRTEGLVKGKTDSVLELLEELGNVPEDLRETIQKETDLEKLKAWHKISAKAESMEEFREKSGI